MNRARGRIGSDDVSDIIKAGREQGIDVLPADITESPSGRIIAETAEKVPVIGTAPAELHRRKSTSVSGREIGGEALQKVQSHPALKMKY